MPDISAMLRASFPVLGDDTDFAALGYRALRMTGRFIQCATMPDVMRQLKALLPVDASIYALDGQLFRMYNRWGGYGSDVYTVVFASSTWEPMEEGACFPELSVMFHASPPPHEGEPIPRTAIHHCLPGTLGEVVIDKRTHYIEIPRDRETEDQLVIVIKPKQ